MLRPLRVRGAHCCMTLLVGILVAVAPPLLIVPLDGRPVRFGAPLPAAVVAAGLRLEGRGTLQWRRLPVGAHDTDPVWIEIAISGPPGTVRIVAGGAGPSQDGRGPAFVREDEAADQQDCQSSRTRWTWCDGTVDTQERVAFLAPATIDGECYATGEARTICS